MTRLSLILLLTLAACTPAKRQDDASYAFPSGATRSLDSFSPVTALSSVGQAPVGQASVGQASVGQASVGQASVDQSPVDQSSEGRRLERVGKKVLAVAAPLCGSLNSGSAPAQATQPSGAANCDYPLVVSDGSEANAFTDGRRVRVTRRLVRFASSDAELAFTVAHEVAHNLLGHRSRALIGDPKRLEYEADSLGLQLVARAGYDPQAGVKLLRRLATSDPGRDRPHPNYPSFSKRADVLQEVAEKIQFQLSADPDEGLDSLITAIAKGD